MSNVTIPELIPVDVNELQFMRENGPTAFARTISEALEADGVLIDRVLVHKELSTLKDGYDARIIRKARELLKVIKKVEYHG